MTDLWTLPDGLQSALDRGSGSDGDGSGCGCRPSFEDGTLVVDAENCEHGGRLEASPDCRETVVGALTERDVTAVRTETGGLECAYEDGAAALLVAAGRFVESVAFHDERLAARARRDPLGACREATGRADAVADVAAETGLAEVVARARGDETALAPYVGPTVSRWRVDVTPPPDSRLVDVRDLETDATVRRYEPADGPERYYLDPVENRLSEAELAVLAEAYRQLASGAVAGGKRAPARAVRAIVSETSESIAVETVIAVLEKHARDHGLLEDLFADPSLSDVFVTAPAASNPLRVTVDGETLVTNLRLTEDGVAAISSRFRRESGRAFSRANPTLDARVEIASRRIRVAGVTGPASDGPAFAFRAHDSDVWTLPRLVGNGTLSSGGAAVLSLAVERGSALLIAGPRGAGKTTLLGALLWELPTSVRTVVIEDTPELPVGPLQANGRDVQALQAGDGNAELSPAETLRTALRLGDGALVVGEVRGEEAGVLYEAMRVGANSEAVLGTIHGDGGDAVFERVVSDLGVPSTSFGATDLVVTLERTGSGSRRVRAIEEVHSGGPSSSVSFAVLFERTDAGLEATGRIDRGNSQLLVELADPEESYAGIRDVLADRTRLLESMAAERSRDDRCQ